MRKDPSKLTEAEELFEPRSMEVLYSVLVGVTIALSYLACKGSMDGKAAADTTNISFNSKTWEICFHYAAIILIVINVIRFYFANFFIKEEKMAEGNLDDFKYVRDLIFGASLMFLFTVAAFVQGFDYPRNFKYFFGLFFFIILIDTAWAFIKMQESEKIGTADQLSLRKAFERWFIANIFELALISMIALSRFALHPPLLGRERTIALLMGALFFGALFDVFYNRLFYLRFERDKKALQNQFKQVEVGKPFTLSVISENFLGSHRARKTPPPPPDIRP